MGLNLDKIANMDHLTTMDDEAEKVNVGPVPTSNPKEKTEYTFDFNYIDEAGKPWKGTFTNRILTLADTSRAKVLESRLNGGQPYESMDPFAQLLHEILAHLHYSLLVKPKWAEDLSELRDFSVLMALWTEVKSHQACYFRYPSAKGTGDGQ